MKATRTVQVLFQPYKSMATLFLMHGMLKLWSSEINFNKKFYLTEKEKKKRKRQKTL